MSKKEKNNPADSTDGASKIEELTQQIERLTKERDEYLQGWQRAKADLANFKRETAETMKRVGERAKKEMVGSIIPVLEAFDESAKNKVEGLSELHTLLLKGLQEQGVSVIAPEEGDAFNPQQHEAVAGRGEVIQEVIRKGYALNSTTIKPAMVRVKNE